MSPAECSVVVVKVACSNYCYHYHYCKLVLRRGVTSFRGWFTATCTYVKTILIIILWTSTGSSQLFFLSSSHVNPCLQFEQPQVHLQVPRSIEGAVISTLLPVLDLLFLFFFVLWNLNWQRKKKFGKNEYVFKPVLSVVVSAPSSPLIYCSAKWISAPFIIIASSWLYIWRMVVGSYALKPMVLYACDAYKVRAW